MLPLTKAEKKRIRIEIGRIIDENCRGCKVREQKRQELGEFEQVHYCNTQCEIGQKLQELGRMLEGKTKRRVVAVSQTALTKEKYLELKAKGANDLKVALEFNLKIADLSKLKKEWGLEGYRLPPVKKRVGDSFKEETVVADKPEVGKENKENEIEKLEEETEEYNDKPVITIKRHFNNPKEWVMPNDQVNGIEDKINRPYHYTAGGIETIDYLKAKMSQEQFEGYLLGNTVKYLSRYRYKNGLEDLRKARWYLDRLIAEMEVKQCGV